METRQNRLNIGLALSLVLASVVMRLLPHPADFAPVAAVAIFGGAVLPRRLALWVPALAMILSDAFIGFYDYRIMVTVWGCYIITALASSRWLRKTTIVRGTFMTLGGSLFFFIVTNFAVWLWSAMYTHTWSGLVQCYAMALPFFRNTLLSDLFYTASLFGLYAFARQVATKKVIAHTNHSV